jgi:hypothetical protein
MMLVVLKWRTIMNPKTILLLTISLTVAVIIVGCGAATPTPAPTQPPVQITVIVTATPPPPTATSAAPSITPLPTVNVTTTVQAAVTEAKPTVVAPTKAPVVATKKPAPPAASATPSPLPLTLPAPVLVGPNFNPNTGQKDERHSPSDALVFEWQSINPLGPNVCYMIRVDFLPTNNQPGAGDAFLQCDPAETQKAQSQTVRFTMYRPGSSGLNYAGLLPNPQTDLWVKWYATIVADQGLGAGPQDAATGIRHKVAPLSPKSDTFQFLLKGGGP